MCGDLPPAGPPARREVASVPAPGSAAPARLRLPSFAVNVNLRAPRAPGKRSFDCIYSELTIITSSLTAIKPQHPS